MPCRRNYIYILFLLFFSSYAESKELRIVSLSPSNTAMVSDLGLSEYLIGITKFCTRPNNATHAKIIGTIVHPNFELISTLQPTIVLGNIESNRIESLDKLESVGLEVLRLGPTTSLDDIIRDFNRIAVYTHTEKRVDIFLARFTKRLTDIQSKIKHETAVSVFAEIWPKPLTTVSRHGFIHDVIVKAGGRNVFHDLAVPYPKISMESVVAKEPEAILILTHSLIDEKRIEKYRQYEVFKDTVIDQSDISELSQPSLTAYINAVEYFAQILHPTVHTKNENEN